nr:glycosyltransferase [Sphingomonas sp. Y57]
MSYNILYIGGIDSSEKGAIGTHTSGVISGFMSNGAHVHGIFLEGREPNIRPQSLTLVKPSRLEGRIGSLVNRFLIIRNARKLKHKFDVIYHRYDPILSIFLADNVDILEYNDDILNQIEHVRRLGGYSYLGGMLRKLIYPFLFAVSEKKCFASAKKVVCVTQKLLEVVRRRQPQARPIFLPNASLAIFDPTCADDRTTTLRLAHVGTLTYWDGILELVEAVKKFVDMRPDDPIRLDIVGSGSLLDRIITSIKEKSLENHVFLHDPVNHNEALEFLHKIDIVPLLKTTSEYGLSPIKFYEARCLGRYLICTDIPHISEIDVGEGIVVPFPFSIENIVDALGYAFDNLDDIRRNAAQRALQASQKHSWHARIQILLDDITFR